MEDWIWIEFFFFEAENKFVCDFFSFSNKRASLCATFFVFRTKDWVCVRLFLFFEQKSKFVCDFFCFSNKRASLCATFSVSRTVELATVRVSSFFERWTVLAYYFSNRISHISTNQKNETISFFEIVSLIFIRLKFSQSLSKHHFRHLTWSQRQQFL